MKAHQFFIASYAPDAEFLVHCLASLRRYARGFLPTTVCVDGAEKDYFQKICTAVDPTVRVVRYDGTGFMRAQIAMMRADELCPDAGIIHLLGSDCLALRQFGPGTYAVEDNPICLVNSVELLRKVGSPTLPWVSGVKRILGWEPPYEFMRRLPSSFPREVFEPMREHVELRHNVAFDYYIATNNQRGDTSEANLLGAYASRYMPELVEWVDCDEIEWEGPSPKGYPSAIGQLWSHGGLDHPADAIFEYEFRGHTTKATGKTPRQIIAEVLYGGDQSKVVVPSV